MDKNIPYSKPSITDLEVEFASDAAKNGWGVNCYKYINKFEKDFAKYLGVNHAIATSSCTGALHMGMKAIGIGEGDEVILADTNWIATASPIVQLGAKPIFVDILKESWCLDPELVEKAITKRTKAIVAVHLYGNLCEMNKLEIISKKYSIPIIEDAAEAIGSKFCDKKAGSMGIFGTFSLHGTKTITTGEGGVFVTNDEKLFHKVLTLSNHGRSPENKKQFWADEIGFKFKMSNIQAALGCAQLSRIDELIAKKRDIFYQYKKFFSNIEEISMNPEPLNTVNGFWMPTIVFDEELKLRQEDILKIFKEENIDARNFFWPLSSLPMFESNLSNKNSYSIFERALNLPSFHDITEDEIERVVNCIYSILKKSEK